MKQILKLDSHQLSAFIKCKQYFALSYVLNIEPQQKKKYFEKGTFVSRILHIYYHRRKRNKDIKPMILWIFANTFKYVPEEDVDMVKFTLLRYFKHYEDCTWKVVATEKGFSFTLYEDEEVHFIYEGRPDLLVRDEQNRLVAVDHKTQALYYDIYPFNNQAIGYLFATGASHFVYNYLKFTQDDQFRRRPHPFTEAQKEDWRRNTIENFREVLRAKNSVNFPKSYNCESKFGLCAMTTICEQPSESAKLYYIQSKYRKRKRNWAAW